MGVSDRIRAQHMVGDPQTIVPKPCGECGAFVRLVENGGWWVIEHHNSPENHDACLNSGLQVTEIK